MDTDKLRETAIKEALNKMEGVIRHAYNQGFNNGVEFAKENHRLMEEQQAYEIAQLLERCSNTEPRMGHWIRGEMWSTGCGMGENYGYYYKCSECSHEVKGGYDKCSDAFCSACGIKMESSYEKK